MNAGWIPVRHQHPLTNSSTGDTCAISMGTGSPLQPKDSMDKWIEMLFTAFMGVYNCISYAHHGIVTVL